MFTSFFAVYYLFLSLIVSLLVSIALLFIVFILYDLKNLNKNISLVNTDKFDKIKNKSLLLDGLVLGGVMLLISLRSNIPRYYIESFLDYESLGIFSAIAYFLVAGSLFANSLGQTLITPLAQQYANKEVSNLRRNITILVGLGFVIGIAGVLVAYFLGEFILQTFYTDKIASYKKLFVLVMTAGLFSYPASFLGYTISAFKMFKIQLPLYSLLLIIILIASYFLIPAWKLSGAAIAILIANIVNFIILLVLVSWKLNFLLIGLKNEKYIS